MAGVSLKCGDCGALLKSVEEAQEHADLTSHSNFAESTEAVLNLICTTCGKPCRSKTGSDLHTKRTGHTEFADKTSEATKPINLETPRRIAGNLGESTPMDVDASSSGEQFEEMVVPTVDTKLLEELGDMGFSLARATRALHCSGNSSLEAAVNWIVEHENDPDIDQMPMVPTNTEEGPSKPSLTEEEKRMKLQELRYGDEMNQRRLQLGYYRGETVRDRARKKKEEEEKRMEREREKERIRIGKELLEAKRIEEENERKRIIALRKAEKEEEKRALEKIRKRLEEDKAERRRKLGLPAEEPAAPKPVEPAQGKKSALPVKPVTKAEQMRECLRSLKKNHKDDDAKVKRAFQTLMTYVGNAARNPDDEKFRKIRLSNQTFQDRVGGLNGGIEFLELCGFGKSEDGEFLFMHRDKVDNAVLNSAGRELQSAIENPHFGIL